MCHCLAEVLSDYRWHLCKKTAICSKLFLRKKNLTSNKFCDILSTDSVKTFFQTPERCAGSSGFPNECAAKVDMCTNYQLLTSMHIRFYGLAVSKVSLSNRRCVTPCFLFFTKSDSSGKQELLSHALGSLSIEHCSG